VQLEILERGWSCRLKKGGSVGVLKKSDVVGGLKEGVHLEMSRGCSWMSQIGVVDELISCFFSLQFISLLIFWNVSTLGCTARTQLPVCQRH